MSVFDEKPEPKSPGCPICGTTNEVIVIVRINEIANGRSKSVTRSRNFCLEHGQDIWRRLVADLKPGVTA